MKLESTLTTKTPYLYFGPMMDLVMLLVIFLLLSSNVIFRTGVRIDPPRADSFLNSAPATEVIAITSGLSPRLFWNEEEVDMEALTTRLHNMAEKPHPRVMVRGDKNTPLATVIEVTNRAHRARVEVALSTAPGDFR